MLNMKRLALSFASNRSTHLLFRSYSTRNTNNQKYRSVYKQKHKGTLIIKKDEALERRLVAKAKIKLEDGISGCLEESSIYRLMILVEERKFDDLFGSLKVLSLTPDVFARVMQAEFGISLEKEIEMKENIFKIMWDRSIKPTASSISPLIKLYGKAGDRNKADGMLAIMIENGIPAEISPTDSKEADLHKDGVKPSSKTSKEK